MLPIIDLDAEEAKEYELDYFFEPNKEIIMDILLPQYAESLITEPLSMPNQQNMLLV